MSVVYEGRSYVTEERRFDSYWGAVTNGRYIQGPCATGWGGVDAGTEGSVCIRNRIFLVGTLQPYTSISVGLKKAMKSMRAKKAKKPDKLNKICK